MTEKQYLRRIEELSQFQEKVVAHATKLLKPTGCDALYMSTNDFNQWMTADAMRSRKYSRNIKGIEIVKRIATLTPHGNLKIRIDYFTPKLQERWETETNLIDPEKFDTKRDYNEYVLVAFKYLFEQVIVSIEQKITEVYLQGKPDKLLLPSQNQSPLNDILFKPRR